MPPGNRIEFSLQIDSASASSAADILSSKAGLSKTKIKDAMSKGAVWVGRKGKTFRLRKATAVLKKGDRIELYYDEDLLSRIPPEPMLISDRVHYTVWHKPAGLMSQGTQYGDHCSILRLTEKFFSMKREVYLVHRLDRETEGLMLIAHTKEAATRLSELFREHQVIKKYSLQVRGDLTGNGLSGRINFPINGKPALTEYEVISYDQSKNLSNLSVLIKSGRTHQIRRHFEEIGHPVIGDPRYGIGNKNVEGMKLTASYLGFQCPFEKRFVEFDLQSAGRP
jgi:tRNA pseudouridine32 synthase/23S rRNA pseudouridine746 synthase